MKQVLSDRIVPVVGTDTRENKYVFRVATDVSSPLMVDLASLLKEYRNDRVEYKKDYKLWNQVYSGEKELEIFRSTVESALSLGKKIHITNCSLREEIEIVQELYRKLGYFDERENRFAVPFADTLLTIGVNIRNLAYSSKDYKSKREAICFIPPPREPGHVKTLFSAINSGIISTIAINDFDSEQILLSGLVDAEKMNLTTLAQLLSGNALRIGLAVGKTEEWIVEL